MKIRAIEESLAFNEIAEIATECGSAAHEKRLNETKIEWKLNKELRRLQKFVIQHRAAFLEAWHGHF